MVGLINQTKISDPLLKKIEQGIDQKVPPQIRKEYLAIIVAGMKIIYHSEMSSRITEKLKNSMNIKGDVSEGVANIIAVIFNEASKTMDQAKKQQFVNAAMPAGISLMCQLLDYSEKVAGTHVTQTLIAEVAQATSVVLLRKFNIDQAQVKQAIAVGQKAQTKKRA
jgi:hypothetical protein